MILLTDVFQDKAHNILWWTAKQAIARQQLGGFMRTKSILCVSFDQLVSEGRCTALRNAGFRVTAATRFEDALAFLMKRKFDLVVLGHRFSREEKYLLAVEAEEKRNTPVLLVSGSGSSDIEIPATSRVLALEGITGILEAVHRLLPKRAARIAA